ncbi:carbohydrate esterase family 3 protein [Periconia macrospinosa]|uniref:Carbohydrate esterase family 3 protein n=1 Tax=Periconia macrospinosa TaxID=97972 RepID=A0A2V1D940_9PLEO|nr:carbohydrate esterase family 3 protein [Periconia macrospinosa]
MASHIAFLSLAFLSSFVSSIPLSTPGSIIDTRENVQVDSRFNYPLDKRQNKAFPLRVLPLGASITYGVASSDGNGYRKALRDQLRFEGWEVNMVGNEQGGTMRDNDVSGYPGFRVDEIIKKAEMVVGRQPNLIAINAGTNDATQNKTGFEVETTGKRMDQMLDLLYEKIPGVTILLSTVLQAKSDDTTRRAKVINPQYRDIVERRRKQNQRIVLAEMFESDKPWLSKNDLSDGVHPTDDGYKKMAAIWWNAFQEADKAGMLQPPNKATTVNRCENNKATKLDANKITIPGNFYEPVQSVQSTEVSKNEGREAVWAKDGEAFYIYKLVNNNYADGARVDIKTNCWAKDVRWLDVNGDGLDDFVCLSSGRTLNIQLNKGGEYPPKFEDVGKCTVPHGGDDGEIVDPKLPKKP